MDGSTEIAGPAPAIGEMSIFWHGLVEKIGKSQSHQRVLFVGNDGVFLCLPSGGVTRTMSLSQVVKVVTFESQPVMQIEESGAPELIVKLASMDAVPELLAVIRARCREHGVSPEFATDTYVALRSTSVASSSVAKDPQPIVATPIVPQDRLSVSAAQRGGDAKTSSTTASPEMELRIESEPSSGPSTLQQLILGDIGRRSPSAATPRAEANRGGTPPSALGYPPSRNSVQPPSFGVPPAPPQQQQQQQQPEIRRPLTPPGLRPTPHANATQPQSAQPSATLSSHQTSAFGGASSYMSDLGGVSPALRQQARDRQLQDLREAVGTDMPVLGENSSAKLQDKVRQQQMIIEELKESASSSQLSECKKDLEHARSLIADLQTALRSQEQTFAEMLRAQEAQRVAEDLKKSLEKQVEVMEADRKSLQQNLSQRDEEITLLKAELKSNQARYDSELKTVREAFLQYDNNVGDYLERTRREHQRQLDDLRHELISVASERTALARDASPTRSQGGHYSSPQQHQGLASSAMRHSSHQYGHQSTPQEHYHLQEGTQSGETPNSSRNGGVDSDELRGALLKHLNTYANFRYNLPQSHQGGNSDRPERRDRSLL